MVNENHELTVDDLIVEYMISKIKNGYDYKCSKEEFMDFLSFFKSKLEVKDYLDDPDKLFRRFFDRKLKNDWFNDSYGHLRFNENKSGIVAGYNLSCYDLSVINTYFMYEEQIKKIRLIIDEYLSTLAKRKINLSTNVSDKELQFGKFASMDIVNEIWLSHIDNLVMQEMWPRQCNDINKYLLNKDLAKIIDVKSIRKDLLNLYKEMYTRLSSMYKEDSDLQINNFRSSYLANINYELLTNDYKNIINIAFGPYRKQFTINANTFAYVNEDIVDNLDKALLKIKK